MNARRCGEFAHRKFAGQHVSHHTAATGRLLIRLEPVGVLDIECSGPSRVAVSESTEILDRQGAELFALYGPASAEVGLQRGGGASVEAG